MGTENDGKQPETDYITDEELRRTFSARKWANATTPQTIKKSQSTEDLCQSPEKRVAKQLLFSPRRMSTSAISGPKKIATSAPKGPGIVSADKIAAVAKPKEPPKIKLGYYEFQHEALSPKLLEHPPIFWYQENRIELYNPAILENRKDDPNLAHQVYYKLAREAVKKFKDHNTLNVTKGQSENADAEAEIIASYLQALEPKKTILIDGVKINKKPSNNLNEMEALETGWKVQQLSEDEAQEKRIAASDAAQERAEETNTFSPA